MQLEESFLIEFPMQGASVRMRLFIRYSYLQFFSNSSIFLWLSWCLLQARFFFQQLISGVSYCHTMVSKSSTLRKVPFLITFDSIYLSWKKWDKNFWLICTLFVDEASMSPWFEVGKHVIGWQPCSSFEDMWLWVLQGTTVSLSHFPFCSSRMLSSIGHTYYLKRIIFEYRNFFYSPFVKEFVCVWSKDTYTSLTSLDRHNTSLSVRTLLFIPKYVSVVYT